MQRNLFSRAVSFCLAAVMTIAVMGALDQLAQPASQEAQWAQAPAVRA